MLLGEGKSRSVCIILNILGRHNVSRLHPMDVVERAHLRFIDSRPPCTDKRERCRESRSAYLRLWRSRDASSDRSIILSMVTVKLPTRCSCLSTWELNCYRKGFVVEAKARFYVHWVEMYLREPVQTGETREGVVECGMWGTGKCSVFRGQYSDRCPVRL